MNIFETLKRLSDNQRKKEPSYIYLDEKDNQIKEIPLKLDSAGALTIESLERKSMKQD